MSTLRSNRARLLCTPPASGCAVALSLRLPRVSLTTAASMTQGHTEVIEVLLEHGADVNRAKSDGATPLFAAAQQ